MRKLKEKSKEESSKRTAYGPYVLRQGLWVFDIPVWTGEEYVYAIVRASTWGHLVTLELYPNLSTNKDGYVMAWSPVYRNWKRLARLIANCNSDQQVSMKDGIELNLLEDNILVIDRDPVTWDRETFLSTEAGIFNNDIEYKLKETEQPKLPSDPLIDAYANNSNYRIKR
jgi:hypothetical protein